MGYDIHSHAPSAFRITSENGAVVKGTASLAGRDAYLQLRLTEEAASPNVPTLPGLERDYLGQHRPAMSSPGPFADLGPSTRTFDIHPNFKP